MLLHDDPQMEPGFDINIVQHAAKLLLTVWEQQNPRLKEADCLSALQEDQELNQVLKDAYRLKRYEVVRGWDPMRISTCIFLAELRLPMAHFIRGEYALFNYWTPPQKELMSHTTFEYLQSLRIPSKGHNPTLILHDLGSFQNDPALLRRIKTVFKPDIHTFFTNVSGSGKTRILFEGLCHSWGFYFTSALDSSQLGSCDMQNVLEFTLESHGLRLLPQRSSAEYYATAADNRTLAKRQFSQVLLARLLIFDLFLQLGGEEVSPGNDQRGLKRSWVLLQLFTSVGTGAVDIFDSLKRKFAAASQENLDNMIHTTIVKLRKHHLLVSGEGGRPVPLFCAFDEAQHAAAKHTEYFLSDDTDGPSPALVEIIRTWEQQFLGHGIYMIVTGTKIPRRLFTSKTSPQFRWCSDTGGFDGGATEAHRSYLVKYLPPQFSDSPSGRWLVERALYWLRGRHRVTSSYIEVSLENDMRRPHSLFNWFYWKSAQIHPTDADELIFEEEKMHGDQPFRVSLNHGLGFHYLDKADILIVRRLATDYTMRSISPKPTIQSAERFVAATMAMFTDLEATTAVIYEPLIMTRIMDWMRKNHGPTSAYLESELRADPTSSYALQNFVIHSLFSRIREQQPLTSIFSFTRPVPHWAYDGATIVGLYRSEFDEADIGEFSQIKPSVYSNDIEIHGSSASLGQNASTAKDVCEWLGHSFRQPFCFPGPGSAMGPDIVFVLRLRDESLIWVVVEARSHSLARNRIKQQLERLTPSQFFVERDASGRRKPLPQTATDARKLLLALPNRQTTDAGKYSLLRVIASPSEVNLNLYPDEDPDSERHPLAGLNLKLADFPSLESNDTGFYTKSGEQLDELMEHLDSWD